MNEFVITGRIDTALTHFAALGLTAILDPDGEGSALTWWADGAAPRVVVASPLTPEEVGERVRSHAQDHCEPTSWVQRRISTGPRAGKGLFTARVQPPALGEWQAYATERAAARSTAVAGALDEQMQAALGEPAWWRCDERETRPDDGASRWEMKTRNQGQEFLAHRLAPVALKVRQRRTDEITDGLSGSVIDEAGPSAADSRTGTGLTQPGPVDSAVAWCALWGLHVAPTVQRVSGVGHSPGVWPRDVVHPRWAALPVYSSAVSTRAFSAVLSSKQFDVACDWGQTASTTVLAARGWLQEHGVRAILRIPVLKTGSGSAPERQLLAGTLEPL